tara:strand:- start:508 stop:723 length:216 start_codon:yes stop_codon:yes gene_type:complete
MGIWNITKPDNTKDYDKDHYESTKLYLAKCKANLGHGHNSGWDDLHYQSEIDRVEKLLASWGEQLEIEFPA